MKIEANIQKKYVFFFAGILILLLSVIGVYASWNETKALWHSGDDVKIQISGQNYSLQEAITAGLIGAGSGAGGVGQIYLGGPYLSGTNFIGNYDFCTVYSSKHETLTYSNEGNPISMNLFKNGTGWYISVGENSEWEEEMKSVCFNGAGAGSASTTPISTFNGQGRVSYNYALPSGNVGWYVCNSGYVVSAIHQSFNGASYFTDYITCSPVPYMA